MNIFLGILDWLFSFTLMVLAVWLLIIATILLNEFRKESSDPDITESWEDVRSAMHITNTIIKNKLRRIK